MSQVQCRVSLAALAEDPYPILRKLQQEEPVSWIEELHLWLVTRRADVVDILRDPVTFTVASSESLLEDNLGTTMLSTDGEAQQRTEAFKVVSTGAVLLLGLLGGVFGLLKVDTWTKGYYTKRLFIGLPLAILGLFGLLALLVAQR